MKALWQFRFPIAPFSVENIHKMCFSVASEGSFSPEKKATRRTQQQLQYRSMAPTEPQKPPLAYATFVTQRPWLALLLLLLLPLILSAIAMPNFTLNDLEGWDVRAGTSSKNNDAWNLAEEQTFPFKDTSASEKTSTDSSSTAVEQPRTVDSGLSLTVYYQDLSDQHNMLRPKGLAFMKAFETQLLQLNEWLDHCWLVNETNACTFPTSIVSAKTSPLRKEDSDIVMTDVLQWMLSTRTIYTAAVVNTFDATTNASATVRSSFPFGMPLQGYPSSSTAKKEQDTTIKKKFIHKGLSAQAETLLNRMMADYPLCTLTCDPTKHDFRVMFDYSGLSGNWAMRQLSADGPLAGLSFAFVLVVMTLHTRSVAIAGVGMLQILLSFPVTYFFYRMVCNIRHFGTLQVLAVYVILGIGADDIFVLYDAFMQVNSLIVWWCMLLHGGGACSCMAVHGSTCNFVV
jgi:hypothetical protein